VGVVGLPSGIAAIAAGGHHTCVVTTAGAVWCWGSNSNGQLGNGLTTDSGVPVAVTSLSSGVVAVAAGGAHTCALTAGGGVLCWGWDDYDQLGNDSTTDSHVPVPVTGLASGVAAISAGYAHTCALTTAGAVQCWGYNVYGQLGNGYTTTGLVPAPVFGLSSVIAQVSAGNAHTCALTTAGAVQCWGYNAEGELGDMLNASTTLPVTVDGL
jgi:alpha-tubulin suppressor-like RCC1 family protein